METSCRLAYSHCPSHHFNHAGAFDIQGLGLICGCTDGVGGRRLPRKIEGTQNTSMHLLVERDFCEYFLHLRW